MDEYETRSIAVPRAFASLERRIRARERHLDIVVVTWVVTGVFLAVLGLAAGGTLVGVAGMSEGIDPEVRIALPLVAVAAMLGCLVLSGAFLVTAWGLHRRRRFGRVCSWVLAGLLVAGVCSAPLGVYAFWVLGGRITDMAFGRFPDTPSGAAPRTRNLTPLPPDSRPRRTGMESYPRPPVAATTPPMGVPRQAPEDPPPAAGPQPAEPPAGLDALPTVQDLPASSEGDDP